MRAGEAARAPPARFSGSGVPEKRAGGALFELRPLRLGDRPGWPAGSPVTLAGDGALRFLSSAPPETHGLVAAGEHGYPRPTWLSWSSLPLQRFVVPTR